MSEICVSVGKQTICIDIDDAVRYGERGWIYEVTVYPIPKNHMRIAEVISEAIKAIEEE